MREIQRDDWESLVSEGQTIMSAHDQNRWELGDLAQRAERKYGESSLKKYAHAINCRASTLYDYHRVSRFYSSEQRDFPMLTWSHFREAMRAGVNEAAIGWLAVAQDNDWPIAVFVRELKAALGEPVPPQKLAEGHATIRRVVGSDQVEFYLEPDMAQKLRELWHSGAQKVRLVIWEPE